MKNRETNLQAFIDENKHEKRADEVYTKKPKFSWKNKKFENFIQRHMMIKKHNGYDGHDIIRYVLWAKQKMRF